MMKVKALRYKKEFNKFQEFVHIEDMGAGPEVFTSALPKLQPESATLEDMKKMFEENDYYEGLELDFDKVELVEFELIETGVVGADIRNKLTPYNNLVALVRLYLNETNLEKQVMLKKFIWKELKQSKKSIKYIANLL